ncbi:hypothetical protein AYO21_09459 [Fonsecaea monophora]|uniref:Uncharacterized protein n=1 Tax=Fonsecaea monophora TaxID=254056 RepID=A0A177EYP6_9EURO|nr:hypothetical protein AYO21_09459 [Fonsecaea monophora]OAG36380.1 hypothetical protein AYO21_09459 [Fonsecaea monophora]
MKAFTLSGLSTLFAGLTLAHPVTKRGGSFSEVDITILQFALTLEHLENTFYKEAFSSFKLQDFVNAGFDEAFFLNLEFIASDESAHVEFLIAAIESAGVRPVQPCQYSFPVTDVASFVTVSAILESVGTSAYLGAAPFIGSRDILSVAASIMATEALHTSSQRSSLGAIAAPNPFTTPLDPNSVFTIASQFIVSCPADNPPLPFTAFPGLKTNSQACFDESGSSESFSTESVNYATVVANIETATDTTSAYGADATDSTTTTAAYDSTSTTTTTTTTTSTTTTDSADYSTTTTTTMDMATAEAAASVTTTTTTTTDMASMATSTPAYARRSTALEARTNGGSASSCSAPGAGSSLQLIPDFSKSHHDFSRVEVVFVTFIAGLEVVSVQAVFGSDGSINVSIPGSIGGGQVFIFITIVDISGRSLSANEVLFGPAIMEIAPSFPSIIQ